MQLSCQRCNVKLRENAKFCSQCGSKQETVQHPPLYPDTHTPSYPIAEAPWALLSNAGQDDETLMRPESSKRKDTNMMTGTAWQDAPFLQGQYSELPKWDMAQDGRQASPLLSF